MNERKFNREINRDINYQILTVSTIEDLIKKEKKDLFNNVAINDLLKKNLMKIIAGTMEDFRIELINYLYNIDSLKPDIEKLLFNILDDIDYYYYLDNLNPELESKILEVINNNFATFLEHHKLNCLMYINNKKKNPFTEENLKLYNEYIENHLEEFTKTIIDDSKMSVPNYKSKDYEEIIKMVSILIKELKEHSNIEYNEVKQIGYGAYSSVYQIGDKVLKIGSERGSFEVGNDKRLLQPLLRINLKDSFKIGGTIEITNVVDTNVKLSQDELYDLFKELRDRGIFYTDLRMDNLGILKSDNTYHWHEYLDDDPKIRGLDRKLNEDEILDKGKVVIIDSDYFYNAQLVKKIDYGNSKIKPFEKKYQEELKKENSKKR